MGLVLAFATAPRPASRPPLKRVQPTQSADILFFTGVRYQRENQSQPAQSAGVLERAEPTPAS